MRRATAPAPPSPRRRPPSSRPSSRKATCSRRWPANSSIRSSTAARPCFSSGRALKPSATSSAFPPRQSIAPALDITDAWKNSYSENTSQKVWAAKYPARHPNLVALELSSFKCGHDAPIYTTVEETVTNSGTPYFSFKDIDENKPTGSIRIRVETISYFLKRYREDMVVRKQKECEIDAKLRELEAQLRTELGVPPPSGAESAGEE